MLKIGIIFGGNSREREVSFAGGRTVYDNLNKSLFEPIPIFVDSFGNFVLLDWQYVYKGSIRDFYPPVEYLPPSTNEFQVYAESLGNLTFEKQLALISQLGKPLKHEELNTLIDFAFLCLHGTNGEDGRIQGLLEYLNIPYSGSGILSSAVGMNKSVQKQFMVNAGFNSPAYLSIHRNNWDQDAAKKYHEEVIQKIKLPYVIKAANQGSSIGLSIIEDPGVDSFIKAVNKSFFIHVIKKENWKNFSEQEKINFIRTITDIREGVGLPMNLSIEDKSIQTFYHPEELLSYTENHFEKQDAPLTLSGFDAENEILVESFINGKEFSCIVVEGTHGKPLALPPTEIRKGKEYFDYRSKYLPGLSRKITPIDLPDKNIEEIRKECERLYLALHFNVYARIDGFITAEGKVFLNDPNTTSGMMPSSFFFHQAAEIGLNPSQFITYIIRTSLKQRISDLKDYYKLPSLLEKLDNNIEHLKSSKTKKRRIAVIFGGYSSERHISVESGRNIYEKLSSSSKYEAIPIFLTGNDKKHQLYQIPINLMLKDNADDIKEKIEHYQVHPIIEQIIRECGGITNKYASSQNIAKPELLTFDKLALLVDGVFIALHGRPGEDGVIQKELERVGLPYNGSGTRSSQITINKFDTNELFMNNGLHVAKHAVFSKNQWVENKDLFYKSITENFHYPFIAKPVDDGCSSAVKKIKNIEELDAFAQEILREEEALLPQASNTLHLKPKEEFPKKDVFLVEELINKGSAHHFLEITGGLLTWFDEKGQLQYEIFEASEALSEGEVLSLEEKFLAGQGQNITPARYSNDPANRAIISAKVKEELEKAARLVSVEGYARIDAFVRVYESNKIEVIFVEVNSLPGMTPATCIFHQSAINGYKPYEFIDKILDYGFKRKEKQMQTTAA